MAMAELLEVELVERERDIEADLRLAFPPPGAAGLEMIAPALEQFAAEQISAAELVGVVDLAGHSLELRLRRRIAAAEEEEEEEEEEEGGQELEELRASLRWLSRFPTWRPRWVLQRSQPRL